MHRCRRLTVVVVVQLTAVVAMSAVAVAGMIEVNDRAVVIVAVTPVVRRGVGAAMIVAVTIAAVTNHVLIRVRLSAKRRAANSVVGLARTNLARNAASRAQVARVTIRERRPMWLLAFATV